MPQRDADRDFRALFAANPLPMWIYDLSTLRFLEVNDAAMARYGYDRDEFLAMTLEDIRPPEDTGRLLAHVTHPRAAWHQAGGWRHRVKSGGMINVEITSHTITFAGHAAALVVAQDVTERTLAEEAQRASEGRYRALFEHAPDGILIADRESYYLDANPGVCAMLGYSRDELIGMHGSAIVAMAEVANIPTALREITTTSGYQREWRFRRKDGSEFAADVMVTTMPDGNLLAMIRDVTERNDAVDALRAAEERMRFALEAAHVGIWDMDYVTGVLRWSETLEVQYGLKPGTFGGTFEAFVERIHPDDREAILASVGAAMKAGADFTVENRSTWPNGTVHWLSGAGRIVLSANGQPVRGVGISIDTTDRRQLEAQYQQAQKMEAIGRLSAGVAHDFNNLLTAILGYCDLLLAGLGADDPRHEDVLEIQKAGTRAAGLTHRLLAFSRKQVIEPTLVDLNGVVTGIREMVGRLIGEDVTIVLGLRSELPLVTADRGQMEQVIMNLALNARDAMPYGGTLTIETGTMDLDARYARTHFAAPSGPHVVLTVSDSGTGMTPEVQSHLFEPFFTTKDVGKGTGLGLSTVHGIVTGSGGSVNVYSEIGRGTSFKVYLPQASSADVAIRLPTPASLPSIGEHTVLVVEDADALRRLAQRLLQRLGYAVVVAANADEAVRLFEQNPAIDVLLTDVVMPGASGPELTRQLVARRPTLKVIYMSGYTDEAIVQHRVLQPGFTFLQKPFTAETLARKVREALDR